jgi:hypothetical protein
MYPYRRHVRKVSLPNAIAIMDKATPTNRAQKPGTLLAKNLNDLSSFPRKKKIQGMDPRLKATWSVIIMVSANHIWHNSV